MILGMVASGDFWKSPNCSPFKPFPIQIPTSRLLVEHLVSLYSSAFNFIVTNLSISLEFVILKTCKSPSQYKTNQRRSGASQSKGHNCTCRLGITSSADPRGFQKTGTNLDICFPVSIFTFQKSKSRLLIQTIWSGWGDASPCWFRRAWLH